MDVGFVRDLGLGVLLVGVQPAVRDVGSVGAGGRLLPRVDLVGGAIGMRVVWIVAGLVRVSRGVAIVVTVLSWVLSLRLVLTGGVGIDVALVVGRAASAARVFVGWVVAAAVVAGSHGGGEEGKAE